MLLLLLTPGAVAWAGSKGVSNNRASLSQQTNNVKTEGVVVDAKGEPLIGVSILEQGTRMEPSLILMVYSLCRFLPMLYWKSPTLVIKHRNWLSNLI